MQIRQIALICCLWMGPAFGAAAQQINTPLADERLDPATCLAAAEGLTPTYRSHLQRDCIFIPQQVCHLRGTAQACLAGTAQGMRAFLVTARASLPGQIDGGGLKARNYARALSRLDGTLADDGLCADGDALAQAGCTYDILGQHMIDIFYRARQAGVDLTP